MTGTSSVQKNGDPAVTYKVMVSEKANRGDKKGNDGGFHETWDFKTIEANGETGAQWAVNQIKPVRGTD